MVLYIVCRPYFDEETLVLLEGLHEGNEGRVWTGRKYCDHINLTPDLFPGHRKFTVES